MIFISCPLHRHHHLLSVLLVLWSKVCRICRLLFAQPEIAGTWRWHLTIISINVNVYVYVGFMPVWVGNYLAPPFWHMSLTFIRTFIMVMTDINQF